MFAGPPTVVGGTTVGAPVGLRGSGILHPTMLKGIASNIANTITNTGITRTTNIVTPGVVGATTLGSVPTMTGVAGVAGVAGVTNVLGEIQGESRIEYVPYEKTVIEYEPVERTEYVPYERKVIEYEDRKRIEQVPVERSYTDYYAIEYITEYYPQIIPETKIEYVPVERVENRVEYYAMERQVVHYPEEMMAGSRRIPGVVGSVVPPPGVKIGASVPIIGLSRVASGTNIGLGLPHHRLGSPLTVPRPSSSYAPISVSNGLPPNGVIVNGGAASNSYGLNPPTSFGSTPGASYGMGAQSITTETGTFNSPTGARYVAPTPYYTTTVSPSITQIKSSEPRIISR